METVQHLQDLVTWHQCVNNSIISLDVSILKGFIVSHLTLISAGAVRVLGFPHCLAVLFHLRLIFSVPVAEGYYVLRFLSNMSSISYPLFACKCKVLSLVLELRTLFWLEVFAMILFFWFVLGSWSGYATTIVLSLHFFPPGGLNPISDISLQDRSGCDVHDSPDMVGRSFKRQLGAHVYMTSFSLPSASRNAVWHSKLGLSSQKLGGFCLTWCVQRHIRKGTTCQQHDECNSAVVTLILDDYREHAFFVYTEFKSKSTLET